MLFAIQTPLSLVFWCRCFRVGGHGIVEITVALAPASNERLRWPAPRIIFLITLLDGFYSNISLGFGLAFDQKWAYRATEAVLTGCSRSDARRLCCALGLFVVGGAVSVANHASSMPSTFLSQSSDMEFVARCKLEV